MTSRYWPLILTLASVWGASYLFIKVGVDGGFSPGALMAARTLIAAAVLFALPRWRRSARGPRSRGSARPGARRSRSASSTPPLPFWLVAWGEKHIDSSVAAIAQATVPIFSLLIGLTFLPARAHRRRAGSPASASASSASPSSPAARPRATRWAVAGTLAVVLASVFYASAGIYSQLHLKGTISGPVLATGSMLAGGVILLPLAIARAADVDADGGRDRLAAAARARRHGARAADPVPRRSGCSARAGSASSPT